jgi:hypothetical protein
MITAQIAKASVSNCSEVIGRPAILEEAPADLYRLSCQSFSVSTAAEEVLGGWPVSISFTFCQETISVFFFPDRRGGV